MSPASALKKLLSSLFKICVKSHPDVEFLFHVYLDKNRELNSTNLIQLAMYLIKINLKCRFGNNKSLILTSNRILPQNIVTNLLKYNVVCFDIFDVMIFKAFSSWRDFYSILMHYNEIKDFDILREQENTKNKSIYDIYEHISEKSGASAETEIKIELEALKRLCCANPYIRLIFDVLQYNGVKVIAFCSQSYTKEMMEELLSRCGYHPDDIIVSSELSNVSMSTFIKSRYQQFTHEKKAGLFEFDQNEGIFYVGSNHEKINEMRKNGIEAHYYKSTDDVGKPLIPGGMTQLTGSAYASLINSMLFNGLLSYSPEYKYGFVYEGILFFGFCSFIKNKAYTLNADLVLFISDNEGSLQRIYSKVFGGKNNAIIHWSDITSFKYCGSPDKIAFLEWLMSNPEFAENTVGDVLEMLDAFRFSDVLDRYGMNADDIFSDVALQFGKFFTEIYEDIAQDYKKSLQTVRAYIRSLIGENKKVCIVDTSCNGYCSKGLKNLIEKDLDLTVEVTCLTMHGSGIGDAEEGRIAYIENKVDNGSYCNLFAPSGFGIKNIYEESGSVQFGFYTLDDYDAAVLKEVRRGIFEFCSQYFNRWRPFSFMLDIHPADALQPLHSMNKGIKENNKTAKGAAL